MKICGRVLEFFFFVHLESAFIEMDLLKATVKGSVKELVGRDKTPEKDKYEDDFGKVLVDW